MKTKTITHNRELSGTQQQDRCQQAAQKFLKILFSGSFLIVASQAWALSYTITDLGIGGISSYALGINNKGQVVGAYQTTGDNGYTPSHAFLYSNGQIIELGALGSGSESQAQDINENGQIVGTSQTVSGVTSNHAFLYSDGAMIDLGTLEGGNRSAGSGINDNGQVVGHSSYTTTDSIYRAFLYSGDKMEDLGAIFGTPSYARDINNSGQIIFENSQGAFLYSDEKMENIGSFGGPTQANEINDSGQIVGHSYDADHVKYYAFLYSDGNMKNLGTLEGTTTSVAWSINNKGEVVGTSLNSGPQRAFLYKDGSMTDLNSLLPVNSGWTLNDARDINDLGQIVGFGIINGQTQPHRAFLMSPVVNLTIEKPYSGGGKVVSNPIGIDCGEACSVGFSVGTVVTLTATPDVGSTFTNWEGDCSGTDTCQVTMDADKSVTANFAPLTLSINDVSQSEGNSGMTAFAFTVSLNAASASQVTVHYATANGSATTKGKDYIAAGGNLIFSPGQISQTITVNVIGDTKVEAGETFYVNLTNLSGAILEDGQGIGTILNDDVKTPRR